MDNIHLHNENISPGDQSYHLHDDEPMPVDNTHLHNKELSPRDNTHLHNEELSSRDNTHLHNKESVPVDNTHLHNKELSLRDNTHLHNEESVPVGEGGHAVDAAGVANSGVRVGTLGRQTVEFGHRLEAVNGSVVLEASHGLAESVHLLVRQHVHVLADHCPFGSAVPNDSCKA